MEDTASPDITRATLSSTREFNRSPLFVCVTMLAALAIIARVLILVLSGNQLIGPFSGIGDQVRFQILTDSILHHQGFTYAGQPTALRAPVYPLLLVGFRLLFGSHFILAVRVMQFFAGLIVAFVCLLLARRWFGVLAGAAAGALALACPTLIFIGTELQTEALATLLTILFLWFASGLLEKQRGAALASGICSGLAALVRFNAALLPVIGVLTCIVRDRGVRRAAVLCGTAAVIISPWIARNLYMFHGRVLYSTHGGINLLEGVLTPQRRGEPWENSRIRAVVGWLHPDIETNSPSRLNLPSEDRLDAQARAAAVSAWSSLSYASRTRLLAGKLACFWFSTDQIFATKSFSRLQRWLRFTGVMAYWVILALAVVAGGCCCGAISARQSSSPLLWSS